MTWIHKLLAATFLLALLGGRPATGADGSLDPTFSGDGWYAFDDSTQDSYVQDLEVDPFGRLLVAFKISVDTGGGVYEHRAALVRLLPSGSLDLSFGFLGYWFEPSFGARSHNQVAVAAGADGSLYVGWDQSWPANGRTDWVIRKLGPTGGALDLAIVDFQHGGGDVDFLEDLLVLPDHRVVAVGGAQFGSSGSDNDMAIAVLEPVDLELDTSFSGDGMQVVAFDLVTSGSDSASEVTVDGLGRFLLGGVAQAGASTEWDFAVARLLANGEIDTSFGTAGRAWGGFWMPGIPVWQSNANSLGGLALGPGGRIYLAGNVKGPAWVTGDPQWDAGVLCLEPNGLQACLGFGPYGNGWSRVDLMFPGSLGSASNYAMDIAVDSHGRLHLAGGVTGPESIPLPGGSYESLGWVARLLADGTLDPAFGTGGIVIPSFDPSSTPGERFYKVVVAPGRVIAAGMMMPSFSGSPRGDADPLVARFISSVDLLVDSFESGSFGAWSASTP